MFDSLNLRSTRIPHRRKWPKGATAVRKKFGQDVLWFPARTGGHHLSEEELELYRQVGDPQVDLILELLEQEGTPLRPGDDLVAMAEQAADLENSSSSSVAQHHLASFLRTHQILPSWADVNQLQRGQEVFLAYAPAISLTLYYRSLVAGFSIPKIAAVIRSTGYLAPPSRPDQVLQRLLDTGQLIAACCANGKDALLPGGIGWRSALHVRALHAKVRRGLLTREGLQKWDSSQLGVPINQEDMAGTLLAFSVNPLLGIEFVAGTPIPRREMMDYLALWRYIGWLLGVETCDGEEVHGERPPPLDPCGPGDAGSDEDPIRHSHSILESIVFHLLDPDETSVEVASHLLNISGASPPGKQTNLSDVPRNNWFYFRALQCRRFIGNPLADALCLPLHPRPVSRAQLWITSTVYLVLLRFYTLVAMRIPPLRRIVVRYHQNSMQQMHIKWQETHRSRMTKALRNGVKLGISDGSDAGSTIQAHSKLDPPPKEEPCCPFAMVAPPTIHVDSHIKPAGTEALDHRFTQNEASSSGNSRIFSWFIGVVTIPLIAFFVQKFVFDNC